MQRHLALLLFLFPLPKRRVKEDLDASAYLDRAKQQMAALHERNKEQVIQAIERKNHLQEQVEDLEKMLANLDSKLSMVEAQGDREQADKLRVVKHDYEQSLGITKEIFQQAVETCEQIKVAITQEEELIRRQIAEVLAIKTKWRGGKWGQDDIQLRMGIEIKKELRRIGVWQMAVPPQAEIDRKTARELVGFLLVLVIALLVWRIAV